MISEDHNKQKFKVLEEQKFKSSKTTNVQTVRRFFTHVWGSLWIKALSSFDTNIRCLTYTITYFDIMSYEADVTQKESKRNKKYCH